MIAWITNHKPTELSVGQQQRVALARMSMEAYKGGQFQYLRVLQAQRAVAEANVEYVRAQADLWQAASDISGLLLEEDWPTQ